MKKLTAGIFATLLAVVSADGAYAAIASQGYVDDKVDAVETTVAGKADSSTVTALAGRVTTAEGEIDTLQTTTGQHTSQIGTINTTLSKKLDSDTAASTYQTLANKTTSVSGDSTDTQYPSAKAVWTAVQSVDANASVEALEGRVETLETNSATKTELAAKQNRNMGSSAANSIVTTDGTGNITASATIAASKVSGLGSLATKSSVATADIASKAVTKEKLADDIVTSLGRADTALQQASLNGYLTKTAADTAYAAKTLEGQVGTVSKENMGTTTATTVVAGVKEAINAAKAAASAASAADGKADAAQATADKKQDKLTQTGSASQPVYVDATGKVTAGNTIPTVTTTIAAGQTGAAQAGAVATALAAKANSADVYTKTTANSTFIPRPGTNCTETGAKCVLVTNGTGFEWEVIVRGDEE